jgi:hypothetical protein
MEDNVYKNGVSDDVKIFVGLKLTQIEVFSYLKILFIRIFLKHLKKFQG